MWGVKLDTAFHKTPVLAFKTINRIRYRPVGCYWRNHRMELWLFDTGGDEFILHFSVMAACESDLI